MQCHACQRYFLHTAFSKRQRQEGTPRCKSCIQSGTPNSMMQCHACQRYLPHTAFSTLQRQEGQKTARNKWDYVDRVLLLLIFFEKLNQWIKVPVGSKTDEIKVIPFLSPLHPFTCPLSFTKPVEGSGSTTEVLRLKKCPMCRAHVDVVIQNE